MAIDVKIKTFAVDTAQAGNLQDVTIAGFGTPNAVMFIWTKDTLVTPDGSASDASMGHGATDMGTYQWSMTTDSQSGVLTTNSFRQVDDDSCIWISNGSGTVQAVAEYSASITDGIRLHWTVTTGGQGALVTAVFFGGLGGVRAGQIALGAEDAQTIVSVGFKPNLVIAGFVHRATTDEEGFVGNGAIGLGFAVDDGLDTQRCIAFGSKDDLGTSAVQSMVCSNRIGVRLYNENYDFSVELDNFGADGFDLYGRDGDTEGTYISYLALDIGKNNATVLSIDSPTTTGNNSQTGAGFKPIFVLQGLVACQAYDTNDTGADAGAYAISLFDYQRTEIGYAIADEDNQDTTDTQSALHSNAVDFDGPDGTQYHTANYVSMDPTGWTLNYSVANGTTRKWIALVIGKKPPIPRLKYQLVKSARIGLPPWQKPLRGAQLDCSHPLSKGLCICLPMNELGGEQVWDHAAGVPRIDEVGGTISFPAWTAGGGLEFVETEGDRVHIKQVDDLLNIVDKTFLVIVELDEETKVHNILQETTSTAMANLPLYALGSFYGDNEFWYFDRPGAETIVYGQRYTLVTQLRASDTYGRGWLDGKLDADWGDASTSFQATATQIVLGSRDPDTTGAEEVGGWELTGRIYTVYGWNRILTPAEIAWVSREPYCIFQHSRPYRKRWYKNKLWRVR